MAPFGIDPLTLYASGMADMAGAYPGQYVAPNAQGGAVGSERVSNQVQSNPLLGGLNAPSMPQTNSLSDLFGGGRFGHALDTAALAASLFPGGRTIGENIAGTAGAMSELPYAQVAHAFQMGQPALQHAGAVGQIGLMQAQAEEALQRGEYYSGRNLASIESMRERDARAQFLRSMSGQQRYGFFPSPDDNKFGKKGDTVYGTFEDQYSEDQRGEPQLKRSFQPLATLEEAKAGGYTSQGVSNLKNAMPGGSATMAFAENHLTVSRMQGDQRPDAVILNEGIEAYTRQLASYRNTLPEPAATKQERDRADADAQAKKNFAGLYQKILSPGQSGYFSAPATDVEGAVGQNSEAEYWQNKQAYNRQLEDLEEQYTRQPYDKRPPVAQWLQQQGFQPFNPRKNYASGPTSSTTQQGVLQYDAQGNPR